MSALRSGIEQVGELTSFSGRAIRGLGGTVHYLGEVMRQAGMLLVG
jgi:hypothetical protein